jgi:transcriptional regulator with XRE-family HTH domain
MAPESVGKRLKAIRESRGLTQDQLADLVGVKERTISRYETGASKGLYDDEVLDELSKALHVEPEDIIGPRAVPQAELHDLRAQLDRIEANLGAVIDALGIEEGADVHPLQQINEIAAALPELLATDDGTAEATATRPAGS